MRSLIECQAEVFRRSEKRIKARRQRRNQILMAGIPLVLCIAVFGALLFSDMKDFNQTAETTNGQYTGAMGSDEIAGWLAGSVEVSGNGISHYYTSAEDVQSIISLLDRIAETSENSNAEQTQSAAAYGESTAGLQENFPENGYRILVKRGDGTGAEYLLVGSLLIKRSTKESFPMGEDICSELKDALGIPLC